MQQITIKLWRLSFLSFVLLMGSGSIAHALTAVTTDNNAFDNIVMHPKIPLLDDAGNNVLDSQMPYSPKQSCQGSGCHDYNKITDSYHFDFGHSEASDFYGKKRGLPHLVSPGYFGGYTCMGGQ